jgi:hypothetical protein
MVKDMFGDWLPAMRKPQCGTGHLQRTIARNNTFLLFVDKFQGLM